MKNLKKALALLLALAMLLCLSACGSFEKKMAKSAAKMSQLKSMHMDMDVQAGFSLSYMGQSMDLDISVKCGYDFNKEPFAMKMDIDISTMGMSQNMQLYVLEEDGQRCVYITEDGGKTWTKNESEDFDFDGISMDAGDSLKTFAKWVKSFEQVGEETINGSTATKFSGEITAENLMEAMELVGVKDKFKDMLGLEFDNETDDMGNIPLSIWIDNKSSMTVRVEMDMTAMMQGIFEQFMNDSIGSALEGSGLEDLPMEFEMKKAVGIMEYSQFDEVPPIELPAGAK